MARRIAQVISIALLAVIAAGCSTAPARFYSLASTATADGTPATSASVLVGPVTIPASVDQPEFVVQVAANRVEVDEFNRWVSPLNDAIARAVAGDLVVLLGTPDVASAQLANFAPDYRVTIDVQRFESIQGQAATLEAVWTVRKAAGGEIRSGRTVAREPVQGQDFEALAAAHSRAIAKMSADIATAIRTEAEQKP
ncbi:MAG: PqiC family protein [Candidatus Binatus sp.]